MSEIIELPMNDERHIELGRRAFEEEAYDSACQHFEAAYNLKQTITANQLLVQSLMASNLPEEALLVADELKGDYLENESLFNDYIHVLLSNDFFIQAEKYLMIKKESDWQLSKLRDTCDLVSDYFLTMTPQKAKERESQLLDIANQKVFNQLASLKAVERLPKKLYVQLVTSVLKDKEVSLIARQGILLNLVTLEVTEALTFFDIEGEKHLFSELTPGVFAVEEQLKLQLLMALEMSLDFEAADLVGQIEKELMLHLKLLFPFSEAFIKEPELWVEQVLMQYLGLELTKEYDKRAIDSQRATLDLIQEELLALHFS